MIIVILGPQGSGKGTQGKLLAQTLEIPFVSAGDVLREEVATGSNLGREIHEIINVRGDLVPPQMITDLLGRRLERDDARAGIVIDSYPRDMEQLELMRVRFMPDLVFVLDLSDKEAVRRLSGRRVCPDGHTYHVVFDPSAVEGVCDKDGKPLTVRADDREEAIRNRLSWHRGKTEPMIARMEEMGIVVRHVDAARGIEAIQRDIIARVRERKKSQK